MRAKIFFTKKLANHAGSHLLVIPAEMPLIFGGVMLRYLCDG